MKPFALPALPALALTFALLSAPSPTLAQKQSKPAVALQKEVLWDWWFVWAGGKSPSREVVYIDSLSIKKVTDHLAILSGKHDPKKGTPADYIQADGVLISEDIGSPASNKTRIRARCTAQQIMFETSYKKYWDTDRGVVTSPASDWIDAKSHLRYEQIVKFICDPKARNDKNSMIRADQSYDPLDTTWAVFWKDAHKPKFTTTKSREQIDADHNAIMAKATEQNSEATKNAETQRAQILRDEKVTAQEQRALFAKMPSKASPLLQSWLGTEERALVASWDVPNSSHFAGNVRFLSYVYGFERQYSTQDQNGNVLVSSKDEFSCNMTFEVQGGIIKDYRSGGNYCGTAASDMPRGPN